MRINSYCVIMSTLVLILKFSRWGQEQERLNPATVGIHMHTGKGNYHLIQLNFKYRSASLVLCSSELHVLCCVTTEVVALLSMP